MLACLLASLANQQYLDDECVLVGRERLFLQHGAKLIEPPECSPGSAALGDMRHSPCACTNGAASAPQSAALAVAARHVPGNDGPVACAMPIDELQQQLVLLQAHKSFKRDVKLSSELRYLRSL